ncbi:MAG: phosphotransferase family protein [Candidatus Eremiobacteraeota bacterium]|nr:phosphotransferase family protein [Candidatus Eremiobacteraeota bacterium]MCW5870021.1 phosphotransferase family protein [Candidatus Eremiobacteraeota bacterium]
MAPSEELKPYLHRIERALGLELTWSTCERLGGLTNRNFRLDCPQGSFVLRIAGEGTADYLNRAHEEINARVASQAGVNVEILFFDAEDGTSLCRFLPEARTMDREAFRDSQALRRAGRLLRQLHSCGREFANRFELFEQIDRYQAVLREKGADLPPGYAQVQQWAQRVRRALAGHSLPSAPCHCDPLAENFLHDGQRMYLIDFEYSGNNDPMWDLGDLSVEAHFTAEQDEELLRGYFGGPAPLLERARMVMYQAMCDLLWTLWGVVQHANGNPADDFWAYAVGRLERCRRLMAQLAFEEYLAFLEAPVAEPRTNQPR